MSLWLWAFPEGCGENSTLWLAGSLPSYGGRWEPQTHILIGQEDGQDESTEEESHEQHKEHPLAGGEVKLQGGERSAAG